MAKGKKTGGRVKGTPNKDAQTLREKARELGVDPFEVLLLFAKADWKALGYPNADRVVSYSQQGEPVYDDVIRPEMRLKAAAEATQYLEPKRKAVEHTGKDGGPIEHRDVSNLTDEQLDAAINARLSKVGGVIVK